jgi:hypothetical protein
MLWVSLSSLGRTIAPVEDPGHHPLAGREGPKASTYLPQTQ